MFRPTAHRLIATLLPLTVFAASCGRLTQPAVEAVTAPPTIPAPPDGPAITPWTGGDPSWSLPRDEIERVLYAEITNSFQSDYPGMPQECYGEGEDRGIPDRETCLFPLLRGMGVSDDAMRFLDETGLVVLGIAGSGPVKIANMWWGPGGAVDTYTPAAIFIPGGFMSASPGGWSEYAAAREVAVSSEFLPRIAAAAGEGPLTFAEVGAYEINPPVETDSGWSVAVTTRLNGGCMGCDVEFAGVFVIGFTADGIPDDVRFDGYCWLDYVAPDNQNADPAAIAALRTELPLCSPASPDVSAIAWENT